MAVRQRDLAVANMVVGSRRAMGKIARGIKLIETLPKSHMKTIVRARCNVRAMLQQGRVRTRCHCAGRRPRGADSADRAMALGIALVRSGDLAGRRCCTKRLSSTLRSAAYVELWTSTTQGGCGDDSYFRPLPAMEPQKHVSRLKAYRAGIDSRAAHQHPASLTLVNIDRLPLIDIST